MDRLVARRLVALALALVLTSPEWVSAQGPGGGFYPGGGGRGRGRRFREQMEQLNTAQPPVVNPNADKPKEDKKDDKPAGPKKDEGPKPITRPPAFDNSASLAEQQMTIDAKRMVSFNFQEAPWTFVVEELARVSGANLDWIQLPGDSFNLRPNKKYTVVEARDIINEHLQARGYAILFDSKTNGMKIVHLDDLNTALVPRVAPEDLDSLPPHDLVKVSFRLEWLLAKNAVDEFKQVLSPKAKLLALQTTNRLEAIDSVINLRQLASILDEEQGRNSLNRLAQEFELRYTRRAGSRRPVGTLPGAQETGGKRRGQCQSLPADDDAADANDAAAGPATRPTAGRHAGAPRNPLDGQYAPQHGDRQRPPGQDGHHQVGHLEDRRPVRPAVSLR